MDTCNYVVVLNRNDLTQLDTHISAVSAEIGTQPVRHSIVTPDETYVALTWNDVDPKGRAFKAFNRKVNALLHARAFIDCDTGIPVLDNKWYNEDGSDEEFRYLLGVKSSVYANRMFGKTVTVCRSETP